MRLLVDTDAFCKLAVGGLLEDAVRLLGADLRDCGRLPALPHMLRGGRLRQVSGAETCDSLVPLADGIPVILQPGDAWLDRLTPLQAIDPGEAQIFAAAAEHRMIVVSGDKRALRALIVDLGAVDDLVTAGVEALAAAFLADVPDHTRWKTLTLSACAFPLSMGGVDRHSHNLAERADWMAWRDGQHARRTALARLPTDSDGVIQHPKGVEGFDPRTMPVSASVRYTALDSWLLVKGESTRLTPPSTQFRLLATQLVYGHLQPRYYGATHCGGCASMKDVADGAGGFGSLEAWRHLGTIHHITTVVQELRALPWP